jgi:two-component system response regulator AtoC
MRGQAAIESNERPLKVTCLPRKGGNLLRLEGVINERAELAEHLRGLTGAVVLDLDKISRITSFGVLQWTRAMEQLGSTYCIFIKCRVSMLTQFNLVRDFGGRGVLVSFYAPYVCPACDRTFDLLLDLRHHHDIVLSGEPPFARCRVCGEAAELNALPEELFSFVASRAPPQIPRTVQQIIDEVVGDVPERLRVRKEVSASSTRLYLSGPVSRGLDLRHWVDGLEGVVILDLAEVSFADEDGMKALASALSGSDVARIFYDRVRSHILPVLHDGAEGAPSGVLAIAVEAECPTCNDVVELEIGLAEMANATSTAIATRCPRCGSPKSIELGASSIALARKVLIEAPPGVKTGPRSVPRALDTAGPSAVASSGLDTLGLVGHSARLRELEDKIRRVADSDVTVLLRGETGTGKELLARAIHQLSRRRQQPFVAVNCAALTESLIESELFGHERGAFTGATDRYLGRFERASGGTLFIDEVGDLPMRAQVKLLRTLQEHSIERVGGQELIPVDIRLIAATHQPLEKLIDRGDFRSDLFYRLSVVPFFVPALRERPEDIWPLTLHYLGHVQRRSGKSGIMFSERSRQMLESHPWPGNVRELVNVVERAVALAADRETIDLSLVDLQAQASVPAHPTPIPARPDPAPVAALPTSPVTLKESVEGFERTVIAEALTRNKGNRTRAAHELGLSRQALSAKITKYGLG